MNRKLSIALATLCCAGGVVAAFFLLPQGPLLNTPHDASAPVALDAAIPRIAKKLRQENSPQPTAATPERNFRLSSEFSDARRSTYEALGEVAKVYPELSHYMDIQKKTLPKASDIQEGENFLRSESLLTSARRLLGMADDHATSNTGEVARTYALGALRDAAGLEGNPHRDEIAALLKESLLAFPPGEKLSSAQKSSLVADKIEAYFILRDLFPEEFEDFIRTHVPEKTRAIMNYAKSNEAKLTFLKGNKK